MKKILIGLAGAVGVGKTTVAKALEQHGFAAFAFADPMKAAAREVFGLDERWLSDEMKNEVHPYWKMTPREIYQKLGTDAMQVTFGDDVWVRSMDLRLARSGGQRTVITDVRPGLNGVQREADYIRGLGGVIVHVCGPCRREHAAGTSSHSSNQPVPVLNGDLAINNNGDIQHLRDEVLTLVRLLERNHA